MKIYKKIVLSIIIMILGILGISTMSSAYSVGQTLSVTYSQYVSDPNLFCVEHGQALKGVVSYRVISEVTIKGMTSTDYTGKSITHSDNARFAAILSASNGSNKETGPVQNAIWNFGYTWMRSVGQYHAGLYNGFMSSRGGSSSYLDSAAKEYAESLKYTEFKDNTNKDLVKATMTDINGTQYIRVGPFNWSFPGSLSEIVVTDQNKNPISNIQYSNFNGTTETIIGLGDIKSDKDFYILVSPDQGVSQISTISGKAAYTVKGAKVWFLESTSGSAYQNLIARQPISSTEEIEGDFDYEIPLLGHLKVIKVNEDNQEVKLQGVGFYIQHKETGKYVKQEADGSISYVDDRSQATEFVTDQNGEIFIENLLVGTYVAYETKNPNYGYEFITDGVEQAIVVDKTTDFVIGNKQIYVKLSGYVWVDKIFGKQSLRNDLFKDNDYDSSDILLGGVKVRLKDTSGNVIQEAVTDDQGAYLFVDVLIEKLPEYYIEFEYDGLTYTNVIPHIDKDNGSKAAENATTRDEFNKNFSVVEGKSRDTGITKDANGAEKHELKYNIDTNAHTATLINNGQYLITAETTETGYNIIDHFTYGQEEVKYINLGLYEREQPDIALVKDLENARLTINGYEHTYLYSQRFLNQGEYGDGFNVGVKFGNKYSTMTYTRPIYKSDYEYVNEQDKSKELRVYVTYKIAMQNQSTNLVSQVNSIVDYYDSNYTLTGIGTGVDEKGNVTGNIAYTEEQYNDQYMKLLIESNTKIEAQKQADIYVQFELSREAVIKILNDGEMLENVAEINSYSTFDVDGNVYAGIDTDSNPGNAIPGDSTTYEDDTDSSPALKLEVADARELTGKVFLDSTSGELMTGQIRQGSGAYEDGETGIQGVAVTFTENTGSGKIYNATTDENGDFLITDFIPGDYTLTYTWGDETYTVQNYKGTIYDATRDQNNKEWYKENVDTRLTDAIDNYETRQKIDDEMKNIKNSTEFTIDKMDSTTPTMGIGVEYEDTTTASTGDKYVYQIKNVDFGIVERARQDIALDKRVSKMQVTLANGQVIADIEIDENGQITGETTYITYLPPAPDTTPSNGLVRLELDNELMEGAVVKLEYQITAVNNSELDYLSENYYKYGTIEGEVVTITPSAVIDYLDSDWGFSEDENPDWQVKTLDEIKDLVAEVVYGDPNNTTVNNKIILYTEALKDTPLKPTESSNIALKVSRILSVSADISLDNETEILEIDKTGGRDITSTPGNYVPGTGKTESDDDIAETVIVIPATGENRNFLLTIGTIISAGVILGAGIFFIRKKNFKK